MCLVAWELRSGRRCGSGKTNSASPHPTPPARTRCSLAITPAPRFPATWRSAAGARARAGPIRRVPNCTNGVPTGSGAGLLGALTFHGLDGIGAVEKDEMRALVLRGGPWSDVERAAILEYCESDVAALARLLPAMLPSIDLPRALLRGRYMIAAARIERNGVPV